MAARPRVTMLGDAEIADIVNSRTAKGALTALAKKYGVGGGRIRSIWKEYYGGTTLADASKNGIIKPLGGTFRAQAPQATTASTVRKAGKFSVMAAPIVAASSAPPRAKPIKEVRPAPRAKRNSEPVEDLDDYDEIDEIDEEMARDREEYRRVTGSMNAGNSSTELGDAAKQLLWHFARSGQLPPEEYTSELRETEREHRRNANNSQVAEALPQDAGRSARAARRVAPVVSRTFPEIGHKGYTVVSKRSAPGGQDCVSGTDSVCETASAGSSSGEDSDQESLPWGDSEGYSDEFREGEYTEGSQVYRETSRANSGRNYSTGASQQVLGRSQRRGLERENAPGYSQRRGQEQDRPRAREPRASRPVPAREDGQGGGGGRYEDDGEGECRAAQPLRSVSYPIPKAGKRLSEPLAEPLPRRSSRVPAVREASDGKSDRRSNEHHVGRSVLRAESPRGAGDGNSTNTREPGGDSAKGAGREAHTQAAGATTQKEVGVPGDPFGWAKWGKSK